MVVSAFWAIEWWEIALLAAATYVQYGLSVWAIRRRHFGLFRIAHTLWHVVGAASISYVAANACGWRTSFSPACERGWVGGLYCNCLRS